MGPVQATMRPPGSKSITNRALICAALADGPSTLHGVLDSEDTRVMYRGLRGLGIAVAWNVDQRPDPVTGSGGRWPCHQADLYVANSGTTMRFLAAMLATGTGHYRLDGVAAHACTADRRSAARAAAAGQPPSTAKQTTIVPLCVIGGHGLPGGTATIRGDISSQFLSGLLLAAPTRSTPSSCWSTDPSCRNPMCT